MVSLLDAHTEKSSIYPFRLYLFSIHGYVKVFIIGQGCDQPPGIICLHQSFIAIAGAALRQLYRILIQTPVSVLIHRSGQAGDVFQFIIS